MQRAGHGAALHVVQVIEVTPTIVLGSSPVLVPSSARLIQQSWQELERLLSAVPAAVTEVRGHVTMGAPVARVLQLTADLGADLPTNPANMTDAIPIDIDFWNDNIEDLTKRFNAWLGQ